MKLLTNHILMLLLAQVVVRSFYKKVKLFKNMVCCAVAGCTHSCRLQVSASVVETRPLASGWVYWLTSQLRLAARLTACEHYRLVKYLWFILSSTEVYINIGTFSSTIGSAAICYSSKYKGPRQNNITHPIHVLLVILLIVHTIKTYHTRHPLSKCNR